jgi:hypothetical protein
LYLYMLLISMWKSNLKNNPNYNDLKKLNTYMGVTKKSNISIPEGIEMYYVLNLSMAVS